MSGSTVDRYCNRPLGTDLSEPSREELVADRAGKAGYASIARIQRSFYLTPQSIAEARGLVNELEGHVDPRLVEDLRLVISEIVTNVYKHSGLRSKDRVEVRLEVGSRGQVCGEIEDESPGFEVPSVLTPEPDSFGGRGLYLIDNLVERWGVETRDGLTRTWFKMDADVEHGSTRSD